MAALSGVLFFSAQLDSGTTLLTTAAARSHSAFVLIMFAIVAWSEDWSTDWGSRLR